MIKCIDKVQLPECLDVIKRSYEDIAVTFGMTESNCPYRGRNCLPYQVFEKEFDDGHLMYGYFDNDKIVGFLSLQRKEQELYIQDIAIIPEYQNKGYGSELMQFAKEQAEKMSCSKIVLGIVHDNNYSHISNKLWETIYISYVPHNE